MTLRLRLVVALVALATLAQVGFFVGTYTAYRSSELARLDTSLRAAEPAIDHQLDVAAGLEPADPDGQYGQGGEGPPPPQSGRQASAPEVDPAGTFAELRSASGQVLQYFYVSQRTARPVLPTRLPPAGAEGRIFTVGSTGGSTTFRVLESPADDGGTTIVAFPTTDLRNAMRRLVLIEAAAIASLLAVLSAGSWLILRHGLRPLERMARTAARISAGDLSQRVAPADGVSEIGQLGLALNTMLEDIEAAFRDMEASESRLRQFLADASHELRTPLTSIQGFAELFRVGGEKAQVDLPTILRRIEQEAARMKALVEDLLLLARLDETGPPPPRAPVDLAVLAADACADAVAVDRERRVTLDAPVPVVVSGVEDHLRQAIANLTSNALRHTPAGSPIEVSVRSDDGVAEVAIRDHGPGLDPEALDHVFDRFWQGDRARVGAGAGLGLSIVTAIAGEHGGTAQVSSPEGGGARFCLRLPLPAPEGTVPASDAATGRRRLPAGSS